MKANFAQKLLKDINILLIGPDRYETSKLAKINSEYQH